MKYRILYFLIFIIVLQNQYLGQIQATFDLKRFTTETQPYIETYLEVFSTSLTLNTDTTTNTEVGVEIIQIIKNKDQKIIDYKKYTINQTLNKDSTIENILDLQRFQLDNNDYTIEIELKDIYSINKTQTHKENFKIFFNNAKLNISDIELLDAYWKTDEITEVTKSGYALIPLVTDYLSPEFNKIAYYFEIYNADTSFGLNNEFILLQSIKIRETGNIVGQFNKIKKIKAQKIIPVINSFNVDHLPTGNYVLVIQLRDKANKLILEKKLNFQRINIINDLDLKNLSSINSLNTFTDKLPSDSLNDFINCLSPIASPFELSIIDKKLDDIPDSAKRQFFYGFWHNRNNNEPEKSWEDYKLQVKRIDKIFSTKVRKGYQTERGRIYLKYGAPNSITDRPNEPSAYPYQIWHYYKIGKFNNKRFIFYLPDLVTNEYIILHSDLPGEYYNIKWQADLNKRNATRSNIDDPQKGEFDNWGSNSSILFKNP